MDNIYGKFIQINYKTRKPFSNIVKIAHFEDVNDAYMDILFSGEFFSYFSVASLIYIKFIKIKNFITKNQDFFNFVLFLLFDYQKRCCC